MNCQQVDKLLYLYCDGRLQPHLRSQIEEHLKGCTGCQHNYLMTAMETETLRDTGDIPPLGSDFHRKVMVGVTQLGAGSSYGGRTAKDRFKNLRQLIDLKGAGGMLAVFILLVLLVKGSPSLVSPPGQNTPVGTSAGARPKMASTPVKTEVSAEEVQPSDISSQSRPHVEKFEPDEMPPSQYNIADQAQSHANAPINNRGSVSSAPADSLAVLPSQFTVVRPHYMPAGYSLVEARSDVAGDLSLTYTDEKGFVVRVFIRPTGGETETNTPAQNTGAASSDATADSNTNTRAKAGTGESSQETLTENGKTESDCVSTVARTLETDGQYYKVEVSGCLPLEELARIADSCR